MSRVMSVAYSEGQEQINLARHQAARGFFTPVYRSYQWRNGRPLRHCLQEHVGRGERESCGASSRIDELFLLRLVPLV